MYLFQSSVNSRSNVEHSDACTMQSPADIYREFTKPKSILKPQTKQELITPVPPPEDFMNYFEEVVCDRDSALTPDVSSFLCDNYYYTTVWSVCRHLCAGHNSHQMCRKFNNNRMVFTFQKPTSKWQRKLITT